MKITLFLPGIILFFLSGCGGSSPASDTNSVGIPLTIAIEDINLNGADVLALKEKEETGIVSGYGKILGYPTSKRCDELGRLDGVTYSGLEIRNRAGKNIKPCFKDVHYLTGNSIYGKYRPDPTGDYVSFITDSNGKVHHLQKQPKKSTGFKSDKLIRQYKGKPIYLDYDGYLTSLNLDTSEEEQLINAPVGHFVILKKNNGDNIVYHDLSGGHVIRPDGGIEDIPEINSSRFYYRNGSEDLGYVATQKFRNIIFNNDGSINNNTGIPAMYSGIPVAYQKWIDDASVGVPPPSSPIIGTSMVTCERSENLLICDGNYLKAYVITGSDEDIEEIKWCDYGNCSGLTPLVCVNNQYIYYYSSNNTAQPSRQLTRIKRDFSSFEHIITNINIQRLTCLNNEKLLISGMNTDTSVDERFLFDPVSRIKTMITEPISEFIN